MRESFFRKSKIAVLAVLAVSVIPMLLVAIYSRPLADDFGYSAATRAIWLESHNIFLVLAAMCREVVKTYFDWQGSFSAIGLFALQPALFSEKIYGLSTVILVGFFIWGNFYFWSSVFGGSNKDNAKDAKTVSTGLPVIIAGSVATLSMQALPHAYQGFYWWNGASYYTLFYSLMLLQWGMLIRKKVVLPCILGFFLGGGNLVTGLLNLEITALVVCASATTIKRSGVSSFIKNVIVMACSLAGFIINAAAPGNAVRAAESTSRGALEAIVQSFIDANQYFTEWMNLPTVLLLLFLLPYMWFTASKEGGIIRRIPMFVLVLLLFGLFASTFTPTEFSMSEVGPRRIQNVRYFTFIVFMVLLESETASRIKLFLQKDGNDRNEDLNDKQILVGYMLALAMGTVIFLGIYTIPKDNRNTLTSIAATRSFLIGESRAYARERDEWTEILSTEDKVVELPALENHPVPIYYVEFDITGDPEDYRDQSMCDFYGKDEIVLLR